MTAPAAIAIDLGATSGRVSLGEFDGRVLRVREVHRFPNDPIRVGERLHWDILRLYHEVKQGLLAARAAAADEPRGFGIDSWGLDFGLLDAAGELVGNPYHYRDRQTRGMMERVWAIMPREEIFARTGVQSMPINTLYQLAALVHAGSPGLARAAILLQIPDLLRYFLTGEATSEYTNATTTQFVALTTGDWDRELLTRLGLPTNLLRPIVRGPWLAGALRPSVRDELGLGGMRAVVVGEHDTASAVVAVPAEGEFAFLSCGTWSLLGAEVEEPVVEERALAWNFANEGGLAGTYRLLRNITGLWLVEGCRRAWAAAGEAISFAEMEGAILAARPFAAMVDPDAPAFHDPPAMPAAIHEWCLATGQTTPSSQGGVLRCIHESLALKSRIVLDRLDALTGRRFAGLHLVGGGVHNRLLCQLTANAIGRPVWAGPAEAATIGNLLAQSMASGEIGNLVEARKIVRASFPIETYEPQDGDAWGEALARFAALVAATPAEERA